MVGSLKFLKIPVIVLLAGIGIGCGSESPDGAALAAEKGCVACHGADGKGIAVIYPNLELQWEEYLRLQLIAYRSGKRENAIMNGIATTLTDEEIAILASHYGK